MDDIATMQVLNSFYKWAKHLRKVPLMAANAVHELSTFHIFHEQKDVIVITEMPVELHNIGVIEHVKQFYLKTELLFHSILSYR